jgi:spermidine/putrescine transport system substrate-binding protein
MSHRIWAKVRHLLVGLTLTGCFGLAMATEDLNVFTWNNALSPETIARFESECACHVNLTYFGSMEEALAKPRAARKGST